MPKPIQKNTSLLVVSDTAMYCDGATVYAFGPVVNELEALLEVFKTITWIGFNRRDKQTNAAFKPVNQKYIKPILLKQAGGPLPQDKFAIVARYPKMYTIINAEIKKHHYIHSRAPSNPAYIAMWLSKKYSSKQFWFKYAGNWIGSAPFFYNLQRNKLKKLNANTIVTVNGKWDNQPNNIKAFENPCLTEKDRKDGFELIQKKTVQDVVRFCFVGGLNENKGVKSLVRAFDMLDNNKQSLELHIVGDGPSRKWIESAKEKFKNTIIVHGSLSKEAVTEVYRRSHFLVLPSKSEGFPKVISEAMNFGCVPITSNISCIGQYIEDRKNGFLIEPITVSEITTCMEKGLRCSNEQYTSIIKGNHELAKKFTYKYFVKRIASEVLV